MQEPQTGPPPVVVSVLIVSHDSVDSLRRCLAALEASTDRASMEILVVDNGSRDGSQAIDSEFPNVNMLRLPHYCGWTKARNIGLRTARGEYVLFLSPEVEVQPATVMTLVRRLEGDPQALAVCPLVVNPRGERVSRTYALPDARQVAAAWRDPFSLPPSSEVELHDDKAILLRRVTIAGINYFDQRYGEYWGHVELAWQIRRAGRKILLLDDVRVIQSGPADPPRADERGPAFAADAAGGAAAYIAKHFGFGKALVFRLKVILGTLLKTLAFQRPGFHLSLLSRLVSGYKIDGRSQEL